MTKPGGRKVGGTVLILAGLAAALLFSSCGASPAAARRELPALVISEVVSSNRESLPVDALGAPDWIELQNIGDTALELEGYGLSDRTTEPGKYIFGKETLEPGQTIVVYAKQVESLHAPFARRCTGFALSKDGETLCLTAPDRTTIQTLTLPALAADVSYARKTDGDYGYCGVPTPGEPNDDAAILSSLDEAKRVRNERESTPLPAMEAGDPVRINEILLRNRYSAADEDGDRGAWVELYNGTENELSLAGYYLSDKADEPYRWAFPNVPIGPGEYLVVFLSGKDRTDAELHTNFRLSEKDGMLLLTDAAAGRTDSIVFGTGIPENVSIGRAQDGSLCYYGLPTPGGENAKSFSTTDGVGFFDADGVYISEVCAVNAPKSGKADWIELRNGGTERVELTDWSLRDDPDGPRLPLSGTIEPGAYRVISLGDDAPFRLSASGETLLLTDTKGRLCDVFSTGALHAGVTSGRPADAGAQRAYFTRETPGGKNAEALHAAPPAPIASENGLYHEKPFLLTLTCRDAEAEIRYTLDGSKPGDASPLYTEPIAIEKSTALRAVACRTGALVSDELSRTYLFVEPHTVPVICVTGAPSEIRAIFEESYLSIRPEYPVRIAFYEADGTLGTAFVADMRIKGNKSSSTAYPQKSLTCHLRAAYGQGEAAYPLFGGGFDTVSAFTLRNSGQEGGLTRVRDAFCSRMAQGLNVEAARTRLVAVYRNARYQGVYYLTEQMNEDWLAARTGAEKDTIEVADRLKGALAGSGETYRAALQLAKRGDFRTEEGYAALAERIDIASFTDQLILKTFFSDTDFYNQRYWSTAGGKLRCIFYDNDMALIEHRDNKKNLSKYFKTGNSKLAGMAFNAAMRQNEAWCAYFVERYAELLATHFTEERMNAVLDEMLEELERELPRQIERFGWPKSMERWRSSVRQMRSVLNSRRAEICRQLETYFGIEEEELQALLQKYGQ